MGYTITFHFPDPWANHGRPIDDRLALLSEILSEEIIPRLLAIYDLREDQLAEVLYDLGCWYADVEIGGPANFKNGSRGVR